MAFEFRLILFVLLLAASLALILVAASITGLYIVKLLIGIVAVVLDVLAMATRYFTYLFEPMYKMKRRVAVIDSNDPYTMSPSGNAIIRREKDLVYATAFVKIPVYASATEMEDAEKADFAMAFGRMLSIIKEPFRLSTQLYVLNKDEYVEKIRRRLDEAQDRYNQLASKESAEGASASMNVSPEAERIRGETTMWRNMLDSVSGARSHSLLSYAAITSAGGTEEEAVNLAVLKGGELATGISTALGISASLADRGEILFLIEPDYMIPIANLSEQITRKEEGNG